MTKKNRVKATEAEAEASLPSEAIEVQETTIENAAGFAGWRSGREIESVLHLIHEC
jgi:hypothetical protein